MLSMYLERTLLHRLYLDYNYNLGLARVLTTLKVEIKKTLLRFSSFIVFSLSLITITIRNRIVIDSIFLERKNVQSGIN